MDTNSWRRLIFAGIFLAGHLMANHLRVTLHQVHPADLGLIRLVGILCGLASAILTVLVIRTLSRSSKASK